MSDAEGQVRLRFDVSYDGTYLHGWAKQTGLRTVQGELEDALATILRQPASLTVAGRTDAGVHALGQVAHVDVNGAASGVLGDLSEGALGRFRDRINGLLAARYSAFWRPLTEKGGLPRGAHMKGDCDIIVLRVAVVIQDFDARFSATGRTYRYQLVDSIGSRDPLVRGSVWWAPTGALDPNVMNVAASLWLGEHDFLSFCKPRDGATTIRTLRKLTVSQHEGVVAVDVEADAFCHSMVRSLVGALVEVGRGNRDLEWAKTLVADPSRGHSVPVAPARGLTMLGVQYPPEDEWGMRARAARKLRTLPTGDPCGC